MIQNETSQGTLLGGRVTYTQLRHGHRSGFEPVLMAAMLAARPHDFILESGTGAGAALLCLAARVPGIKAIGIERDQTLAALAARNFEANGFAQLSAVNGDAIGLPFAAQTFRHVMANPPWFDTRNTISPDSKRALAHHVAPTGLRLWLEELLRVLRDQGSITLALPAFAYIEAVSVLRPVCGGITLFPLWPRGASKAKIILVQAKKASRVPDSILPGLVLHDETGLTPQAEAVLRDGLPLLGG